MTMDKECMWVGKETNRLMRIDGYGGNEKES